MAGTKGKSGKKKTPTAELDRRGSKYGTKYGKRNEPKIPSGLLFPSRELSECERSFYDAYAKSLQDSGVMKITDSSSFEMLAHSYYRWETLRASIEAKQKKDIEVTATDLRLEMNMKSAYISLAREFGLTPSARAGFDIKEKLNDIDEIMEAEKLT